MSRAYFSDWLTDNSYTLPTVSKLDTAEQEVLDTATRANIEAWFQLRQIVPHFDVFFQRALNTAYPYYVELLRVDPSVSSFDWLVDNYVERQTASTDDTTRTPDLVTERTPDLTSATEYNSKTQESGSPKSVQTGSIVDTSNGTDTATKTGTVQRAHAGSETDTKTGGHTEGITGSETVEYSGSEQDAHAYDSDTTRSGSATDTHDNATGTTDKTRATGYGRTQPMSQSVSAYTSNPSSESISLNGSEASVTYPEKNFEDPGDAPVISNPTSTTDSLTSNASMVHDIGGNTTTYNDVKDAKSGTDTDTKTFTNRQDTRTFNGRNNTLTYNSEMNTHAFVGRTDTDTYNTKDATEYGKGNTKTFNSVTDQQTLDKTEAKTGTDTVKTTGSETTKATGTETTSNQHILRDIATGRNQNVADLLQRAKVYIRNSRAWDYLKAQLDPCFYQVYDLDDLVYSEED